MRLSRLRMVLVGTVAATAMLVAASAATAAEIVVNTTSDHAPNGCAVSPGDCTLREAVISANETPAADTVKVPAGNFKLSVEPTRMQIERPLTVQGAGIGSTVIDAGGGPITNGIFFAINVSEFSPGGTPMTVAIRDMAMIGTAHADGGVIVGSGSLANRLELTRVAITGNTSTGGSGSILAFNTVTNSGELSIVESVIAGNNGTLGGAVVSAQEKTNLTIERSTIANNTMNGQGISVGNQASATTIANSTISGNTTTGFTFLDNTGKANFSYNTIDGNTPGAGLPVLMRGANNGWILKGNVISGNVLSGGGTNCKAAAPGALTSQGFNFEAGNSCSFSNPNDHANTTVTVGPLQSNGGPTPTHALPAGSPAIDAGGIGGCSLIGGTVLTTDQRGAARPFGSACDSGAYEYNPSFDASLPKKATPADTTAPTLSGAAFKPSKFKVDRKGTAEIATALKKGKSKGAPKGSTLGYTLSESAGVLVTVEGTGKKNSKNKGKGKKKGAKASKKKKAAKKVKASFTITSTAGATAHAFSGKIGKTTLKPGKYKATLVATDAAGNHSAAQTVSFTIVAR